jgi:hypothetical protein
LANGYARPQVYDGGAEVHASKKAMHVVEPRRRLRLPQVHLQRAPNQAYGSKQEKADLDDALTGEKWWISGHGSAFPENSVSAWRTIHQADIHSAGNSAGRKARACLKQDR